MEVKTLRIACSVVCPPTPGSHEGQHISVNCANSLRFRDQASFERWMARNDVAFLVETVPSKADLAQKLNLNALKDKTGILYLDELREDVVYAPCALQRPIVPFKERS